ncbi:hypothetical protein BCR39DRAFT_510076 [Naematelia encephala]|uniref:Copper-fist domain-containing protein n=1 Tax=Naematelia encephala TaxID=71784 RepID=A0A1Y2BL35_9TREE|nr:hypothetical protein BCR39DRAFT_510076 [Naematelia encephala]
MVLINDKKFACGTCIKGHRVSGCTHTDRPLFEVKKKGRPATQCQFCREKRKGPGASVHTKCQCGDPRPPTMLLPNEVNRTLPERSSSPSETPTPPSGQILNENTGTRKGVPGSTPTFPNGLRDVHDMAAAADVLSTLGSEDTQKLAERSVANLLNPCTCRSSGICKCCQPKRERIDSPPAPGGSVTPTQDSTGHAQITDSLIEMFQAKATTSTAPTAPASSSVAAPLLSISTTSHPAWQDTGAPNRSLLSPENMRHPAHTSPHVHKTKLYSPYSTSGHASPRHANRPTGSPLVTKQAGWASSSAATTRPPPPKIRPLADMNTLLGAVFKDDGTVASQIPRSALGLPGIKTFDAMAESGGVKVEPMEMDVDEPLAFPTSEDVVIGACTCGDDCECAGCATHRVPASDVPHTHDGSCGDGCKSNFNCADHLSLPSGITSIGHLLSIAAANVPQPVHRRSSELDAHDTRILPPAVLVSDDAARSHGVVSLKPLECCNGRCQCPPGQCTCEEQCCGCCVRCACDEDGEQRMDGNQGEPVSSCCGGTQPTIPQNHANSPHHLTPPSLSPGLFGAASSAGVSPVFPSANLTPPRSASSDGRSRAGSISGRASPGPSSQVGAGVRRASSTSQKYAHKEGNASLLGRRATVIAHPSGSLSRSTSTGTGKSASKALALHATPNHPHAHSHPQPRPILPKPPSQPTLPTQAARLAPPSTGNGSATRRPSPSGRTNSSGSSRATSPSLTVNQQIPQIQTTDTSTESSAFDLDLSSLAEDSTIMSYINGLPDTMDFNQMDISASSGSQSGQDQVPGPADYLPQNATTLKTPDLPVDYEALLAQLLAQQQQSPLSGQPSNTDFGDHPYAQFLAQLQPQTQPNSSGGSGSNAESIRDPNDHLFNFFSFVSSQNLPPIDARQLSTPAPRVSHDNPSFGYEQPQLNMFDPMLWNDELQQFATQLGVTTSPPDPGTAAGSNQPLAPTAAAPSVNPNLIDLSKPLDGSALERIMKALEEQNRRTENTSQASTSQAPLQHLQLPSQQPQSVSHHASSLSTLPQSFAQHLDLSVPPRQAYSGSTHSASSGNTSFDSSNPEDIFDQFVYDPPPDRNDSSSMSGETVPRGSFTPLTGGITFDSNGQPIGKGFSQNWVGHKLREYQM